MRLTFHVQDWTVACDYTPGEHTRGTEADIEPELDLRYGTCSDGRELGGLALEGELHRVGVDDATLLRLARQARARADTEARMARMGRMAQMAGGGR